LTKEPDLTIRDATIADAPAIQDAVLGIADALGDRDKVTSTIDDVRRHGFGDAPAFKALIAEVDGATAGVCVYFPSFSTWYGRPGVYVQDLYVRPAYRQHGIAEKLMRRLGRDAKRAGGTYIRLSVDIENVSAQRFYEKIGMKWSKAERIYVARHADFAALAADDGDDP